MESAIWVQILHEAVYVSFQANKLGQLIDDYCKQKHGFIFVYYQYIAVLTFKKMFWILPAIIFYDWISFRWCFSDKKSPQVSRILLSLWADLNSPVVWMVWFFLWSSIHLVSFPSPLGTVPNAQTTIDITVFFMRHIIFISLAYLFSLFHFHCWKVLFLDLIFWTGYVGPFVFQNRRKCYRFNFQWYILVCALWFSVFFVSVSLGSFWAYSWRLTYPHITSILKPLLLLPGKFPRRNV